MPPKGGDNLIIKIIETTQQSTADYVQYIFQVFYDNNLQGASHTVRLMNPVQNPNQEVNAKWLWNRLKNDSGLQTPHVTQLLGGPERLQKRIRITFNLDQEENQCRPESDHKQTDKWDTPDPEEWKWMARGIHYDQLQRQHQQQPQMAPPPPPPQQQYQPHLALIRPQQPTTWEEEIEPEERDYAHSRRLKVPVGPSVPPPAQRPAPVFRAPMNPAPPSRGGFPVARLPMYPPAHQRMTVAIPKDPRPIQNYVEPPAYLPYPYPDPRYGQDPMMNPAFFHPYQAAPPPRAAPPSLFAHPNAPPPRPQDGYPMDPRYYSQQQQQQQLPYPPAYFNGPPPYQQQPIQFVQPKRLDPSDVVSKPIEFTPKKREREW